MTDRDHLDGADKHPQHGPTNTDLLAVRTELEALRHELRDQSRQRRRSLWRSRWAAIGAAVSVALGGGGIALVRASVDTGPRNVLVPITPCRLFDTRAASAVGTRTTPLGPSETHTFTVWGTNGNCTIPNTATAVVLNLTGAPGATTNTFLTLFPADAPQPAASSVNIKANDTVATPNLTIVKLSATGQVKLFNNSGSVNVIGDIVGYFDTHTHDDSGQPCTSRGRIGIRIRGHHTVTGVYADNCLLGEVTTIAGSTPGFVNGNGTFAQFSDPDGIAIAPDGSIVVADTTNHRIRRIATNGDVTTIAGSSTPGTTDANGTSARFDTPRGIAIAPDGSIVVADTRNHRIRRIATNGDVTTVAGSTSGFVDANGTSAKFNEPHGVAVTADGSILVTDRENHRIRRIAPNGDVTTIAGSGTIGTTDANGTSAQFKRPRGVAVAADGSIIVVDTGNHRIRRIAPNGDVTTIAGSTQGFNDGNGTSAQFNFPAGLDIAADGSIIIADSSNHRIRRIAPNGDVTTIAGTSTSGSTDGTGAGARFFSPTGVRVTSDGTIVVGDLNNDRIRRVE